MKALHPADMLKQGQVRQTWAFGGELKEDLPAFTCAVIYEGAAERGAPLGLCGRPLGLITNPDPPRVDGERLLEPTTVGLMCLRTGALLHGEPGWWPCGGSRLVVYERILARRGDAQEGSKRWKAERPPHVPQRELHITAYLETWRLWWHAEIAWTPRPERNRAGCMVWCGDTEKMHRSAERIARPCDVRVIDLDAAGRGEVAA